MSADKLKTAALEGDINLLYTVIQEEPYVLELNDSIPFVETPLHIAASHGHLRFATEIMRLKPSFAWKLNPEGHSPIHIAMQHDQKRMVLRFVDINKDLVRVKGKEGLTPLHLASQSEDIDLLANFLSACPDSIEDVTVTSETALHIAVKCHQYEALQVLVGWLNRTRLTGATQLENRILNWKDESGDTILHVSTHMNDSQALPLLVKTKVDLKAKNFENKTALDVAVNAQNKGILLKAGAKLGSSVTDAPTFAKKLKSNITILEKTIIDIIRIRRDITEDQRNAFLIVAALVATTTYQSALSPPGGVYQANAGDNNANTTSFNSTSNLNSTNIAGTSVMSGGQFLGVWILNTLSFFVSTITIYILTPGGVIGAILLTPMLGFTLSYLYSMTVISPTNATLIVTSIMLPSFCFSCLGVFSIFEVVLRRRGKYWEIKTWTSARVNEW